MAKKSNYWNDKHQQLCVDWLSADTKQQYKIFNELSPALKQMIEIINNRYYNVPFNKKDELEEDTLNHVISILNKYDPEKQKAYSWLGTIIKYYIYDQVVMKIGQGMPTDSIEEYMPEDKPIEYYQKSYDKEALIDRLQEVKSGIENEMELDSRKRIKIIKGGYTKVRYELVHASFIKRIKILELMIEYTEKFERFNNLEVLEYIVHNSDITTTNAVYHIHNMFGIYMKSKVDGRDARFTATNDYMMDDYPPNVDKFAQRNRKRKIHGN